MTESSSGFEGKLSKLVRLVGAVVAVVAVIGLPLRLFWELQFRSVGVFGFIIGMLLGALISKWLVGSIPRVLATSALLLFAVVLLYWFFMSLVDQPEPPEYAYSMRQLLEFFVFAVIYFSWGIATELTARYASVWR